MSSEIMNALSRLGDVVENLESAACKQEQKVLTLKQQDLFSVIPANGNGASVSPEMVAQKLDMAIARVEEMLAEA